MHRVLLHLRPHPYEARYFLFGSFYPLLPQARPDLRSRGGLGQEPDGAVHAGDGELVAIGAPRGRGELGLVVLGDDELVPADDLVGLLVPKHAQVGPGGGEELGRGVERDGVDDRVGLERVRARGLALAQVPQLDLDRKSVV